MISERNCRCLDMMAVDATVMEDVGLAVGQERDLSKERSGESAEPHHVTH